MALTKVIGSGVGDLSTFTIDGSANDLMTFRTTGDSASQVLGLQFQNNSEAVTAQIFGTGDNSSSGVFRIKGIGSVELHGGDVAVSGDATNMLKIDANGHVTMPNQSAFLIKASGGQTNIAINTMTEVQWNGTEVFDQNSDFASHTFTAPVTGRYQFNAHMYLNSLDTAASYYQVQITTSNRSYPEVFTPNFSSDPTYWSFTLNMLTDMDASDTATISVYQSGGTAQLDVDGGSYFSGYLVC